MRRGLFPLGKLYITPAAIDVLSRPGENFLLMLSRHRSGDWGELGADDWRANDTAVQSGERIFSSYWTKGREKVWIITEADRSVTTILLPDDY
jgi:hypothetical protein